MQLIIGNKNYSSWSLRGWLMLAQNGIVFEEQKLKLLTESFYRALQAYTPAAKVPVLIDGDVTVWDSLAICEYVNEVYCNGNAWPQDQAERAKARAISCEMHSGFMGLRNEMPMNCRAKRRVELSDAAKKDIARVDQIWCEQMALYGDQGGWLFGEWSIADCMFAPVVLRFITYGIEVSELSQRYMAHVLQSPAIRLWLEEALQETQIVPEDEAGTEV
ncbi:glutathione S-transferase family protein [Photobacterium galatheae]|uniref:Glutathione S-transferase n=1 Tax=Photobacterium galatheae TaxID=1654360 RepID=A0A066RRH6_9GAMM|nr:glutathione S-transferase family protein [Photobacterium galatheae]KDM91686.1 glutathione S-transferase [Photobacterium galatheae]MCM0149796.1 glutathione S-transferase family protein [Photobacterium galatheae]